MKLNRMGVGATENVTREARDEKRKQVRDLSAQPESAAGNIIQETEEDRERAVAKIKETLASLDQAKPEETVRASDGLDAEASRKTVIVPKAPTSNLDAAQPRSTSRPVMRGAAKFAEYLGLSAALVSTMVGAGPQLLAFLYTGAFVSAPVSIPLLALFAGGTLLFFGARWLQGKLKSNK